MNDECVEFRSYTLRHSHLEGEQFPHGVKDSEGS